MKHILRSSAVPMMLLSLAALVGCGGAGGDVGAGGSGGSAGAPPADKDAATSVQIAEPPPPGPAHAPDGAGHVTFAIDTILLGDRDRDGQPDANAWKQYGFDLDGLVSGAGAPDGFSGLCIPEDGATHASAQTDGDDGIDNAFGQSLLPLAMSIDSSLPDEVAAGLAGGGTTVLIDLDKLGDGAEYTDLAAGLYTGAALGKAPAYDGTDVWPIRSDSLDVPDNAGSPRLFAASSYVVGDTWVGRFHGVLPLELSWMKHLTLHLYVRDPVITMHLDAARTGAGDGTLAGVIATEDLLAEAQDEALRLDSSLCPDTPTIEVILAALGATSDILADGTQDPTRPCDGISVGLGFTAKRVVLGPIVAPAPAAALPACTADGD